MLKYALGWNISYYTACEQSISDASGECLYLFMSEPTILSFSSYHLNGISISGR